MRAQYAPGPGSNEGLSPFHAYIAEHINELADEASGDVEAPTGWFALVQCPHELDTRRRSFLVTTDSLGFNQVYEYKTYDGAGMVFDILEAQYDEWASEDDEPEPEPEPTCHVSGCDNPVDTEGACRAHSGGLWSELRYTEGL